MKRLLSVAFVVCLVFGCLGTVVAAASPVDNGKCGDNLYWVLENNGTLTISGTGPMYDYVLDDLPWAKTVSLITNVVVTEGVTTIGNGAFAFCENLEFVTLPNSLVSIGSTSFFYSPIKSIVIPEGVVTIGKAAFDASHLVSITLPESLKEIQNAAFWVCNDLTTVYYNGSPLTWETISIEEGNNILINANRVFAKQSADGLANFTRTKTYTGQFTDVPSTEWFAESVKSAYEFGLMQGSSDTTFIPKGSITIAESLAIACRINSIYNGGNGEFKQGFPWYQVYVDYAVQQGIIQANQYNYEHVATRAQFASILANSVPVEALAPINTINSIPDVPDTASWKTQVYLLYRAGVLTGSDTAGTFNPENAISRSEVSAIITRIADKGLRRSFNLTNTPNDGVAVQTIVLSDSAMSITPGETIEIRATCIPKEVMPNLKWSSSDPTVASIAYVKTETRYGDTTIVYANITAISAGTTVITATAPNGVAARCTVTIHENYVAKAQAAVDALRSILKNPNSLILNSVRIYQGPETEVVEIDYSAMNGFGGYNRGWFHYSGTISMPSEFSIIDRHNYPYVSVDLNELH